MRILVLLLAACAAHGQMLTSARVSYLSNRYHGRAAMGQRGALTVTTGLVWWGRPESLGVEASSVTSWTNSAAGSVTLACTTPCPIVETMYFGWKSARYSNKSAAGNPMNSAATNFANLSMNTRDSTAAFVYRRAGSIGNGGSPYRNYSQQFLGSGSAPYLIPAIFTDGSSNGVTYDQRSRTWATVANGGTYGAPADSTNNYIDEGPTIIIIRFTASGVKWTVDGRNFATPTENAGTLTIATLGSGSGYGVLCGNLFESLIWSRAISDAEVLALQDYLFGRYAMPSAPDAQIVFDGNSLVAGHKGLYRNAANYVQEDFRYKHEFRNEGQSGYTLTQMVTTAAKVLDPYIRRGAKNVIIAYEGTNQITYGTPSDAAGVYALYAQYCTERKAAGWDKCLVETIIKGGALNDTTRNAVNTSLRGAVSPPWDALIDSAADAAFQVTGNTTYFSDGTHLTEVGQRIRATYITAALRGLGL